MVRARSLSMTLVSLLALGGLASGALAQTYPTKPVLVIAPIVAGGPYDVVARGVLQSLAAPLGQSFVMDNRPGANGIVGLDACAHSAPDGYTLCYVNNSMISMNPFVYAKLPYDPPKDLAPVFQVGFLSGVIAGHPSLPPSMREVIELAKQRPNTLAFSSLGVGSSQHLYIEWLRQKAGAEFLHVPYKGAPPATAAVVSGEVQLTANAIGALSALFQAGKLRPLLVTSPARSPYLPNVPSFGELGIDLDYRSWSGFFAPAGTPRPVIDRLNVEMNRAIAEPKFKEAYFDKMTIEPGGGPAQAFEAFLRRDRETTGALVKLAGIKPE